MTTIAPTQAPSIAKQLSSKDHEEGLKILNSHPLVVDMNSLGFPIDKIVDEVFARQFDHEPFSRYIRKIAGYEVTNQKAFVKQLLSSIGKS